jgi:hypothetical protein
MLGTCGRSRPFVSGSCILRFFVGLFLLFAVASTGQTGTENSPSLDENVSVLHFERMNYPLYAKVRHIQGAVVLQATADSLGQVSEPVALSGPKALLKESMENLKKWRFAKPRQATVVVVYWFRFSGLCEPPCPSGFEFYPPNLVVVTTGNPIVTE